MLRRTYLWLGFSIVLLPSTRPASAQEGEMPAGTVLISAEGGGTGEAEAEEPIDLGGELDYSSGPGSWFDEEAYHQAQGKIIVGTTAKGKYSTLLSQGAVQIGGGGGTSFEGPKAVIPNTYIVQPGDTLLGIAGWFFGDPDLWPEIWAQNPEITNPNWIYPGQRLVIVPKGQALTQPAVEAPKIIVGSKWKEGTVFFRNPGFVDKEIEEASGKIIGSFHENKYLSHLNSVYIKYKEGKAPGVGATATIYRVEKKVKDPVKKKKIHGKLVRILGTVRVVSVDEEHRIAKAIINESVDAIERGDLVGPVRWKLATVAPVDAALDLDGKIIESLVDISYLGQHHVVFIDLGYEDGVVEGNQLLVLRKRDHYMASIKKKDADPDFPWEIIGKVMVLEALKKTSTCLIVDSSWDIKKGDKVEMKRGM